MFNSPVLTKTLFQLRQISRRLWVRTTLIAALALVSAGLSRWLGGFVPDGLADKIDAAAVSKILEIIASSMLAVTTFSLSVMMAARQWASSQSTPRAHRIVLEDSVTQIVLATFLGAFIYALTSLVLIETGIYTGRSVVVVLGFTVVVIALVVIAILRWIDHLSKLGGVSETAGRIERAAHAALSRRLKEPCLGGRRCRFEDIPKTAYSVGAPRTGYVQHVDLGILDGCAEATGAQVWITAPPGFLVAEGQPLVRMTQEIDADEILDAFLIADDRNFDQDPAYGVIVISEIAQRALSPGVNDPGTAVAMISRLLRLLVPLADSRPSEDDPRYPRVYVPPVSAADFLRDGFAPIGRDGADKVEVGIALQGALAELRRRGDADMRAATEALSREALAFAEKALAIPEDFERVRAAAPTR